MRVALIPLRLVGVERGSDATRAGAEAIARRAECL